jgi:hypothetical protein
MQEEVYAICKDDPISDSWDIVSVYLNEQSAKDRMIVLEKEHDDKRRKECEGTDIEFIEPDKREYRAHWIQPVSFHRG